MRAATFAILVLMLAACQPRGAIVVVPDADGVGQVESIFIGTSRGVDPATGAEFGIARSPESRFARLDVSIPPIREAGEITWPKAGRKPDPTTQFVATGQTLYPSEKAFQADIRRYLDAQPRGSREIVIFVHGFNNTYAEGAYRLAQLGHDLELEGALVHYSWPSRGKPLGYVYDRDSALFARDGLEALIRSVEGLGADRILLIAHSLGSSLTMETLRQIAVSGDRHVIDKIGGVMLMSPDIDVDVFRSQAERIGKLPQPFVLFNSTKDRALAISARLTGQTNRLGNMTDISELSDLQITLLDTSAYSTGAGHFNTGNSPALLKLVGRLAEVDSAFALGATNSTGLLPGAVLTVRSATEIVLSPVTAISN